MHRGLQDVKKDGTFGHVLEPGLEYQIRAVEHTVMTGTKGREGGILIIMMLSMQCAQGVYFKMHMTGGLSPDIFCDTQTNKYQAKSDPKT